MVSFNRNIANGQFFPVPHSSHYRCCTTQLVLLSRVMIGSQKLLSLGINFCLQSATFGYPQVLKFLVPEMLFAPARLLENRVFDPQSIPIADLDV